MSGWRDTDGNTAGERSKLRADQERNAFFAAVRHRPLSLLKGFLGLAFIFVLVLALLLAMRG